MKQKTPAELRAYAVRRAKYMQKHREDVQRLLTEQFYMNQQKAERILRDYFAEGFLPSWYFHHNSAEEIASHIFVFTQLLNAGTEFVKLESTDGKAITYLVNVGWDFAGKLGRIIKECASTDILRYESVMARSGVRITTIEKACRESPTLSAEENREIARLKDKIISFGAKRKNRYTDIFLQSVPCNYLTEEINTFTRPRRVYRHLVMFQKAMDARGRAVVQTEKVPPGADEDNIYRAPEKRITIAVSNPDPLFPVNVLNIISGHNISLIRSYYNVFENVEARTAVAILSAYVTPGVDTVAVCASLSRIRVAQKPRKAKEAVRLERKLERIVRCLSSTSSGRTETGFAIDELQTLVRQNSDIANTRELSDVFLNACTDFFEALRFLKIDQVPEIVTLLMGFSAFDEFFVLSKHNGEAVNLPGFRAKHNAARGAHKGGIRLDPIVRFGEIAALSFMMTWKCARTRILFGGGKGGLVINPKEYNRLDLFDTLSNFGRSLFLITGPAKDIPAGDVGCGAEEIGEMFEGFKSALRDLALMTSGIKNGISLVGNRVVSRTRAREILQKNFDVDVNDDAIIQELINSELYLELVAAAQITGKPNRGIAARNGATGRGLCYAILAAVTRLYLDDMWQSSRKLTAGDEKLLNKLASLQEDTVLQRQGRALISSRDWKMLTQVVFPKLLKGKKVVIQGIGKVGLSIARELKRYGVNIIAVANRSGALIGGHLDPDKLAEHARRTGTLLDVNKSIRKKLRGAHGLDILQLDCDLLIPCAMENVITAPVAGKVKAKLVACGGNGTNTSKAEKILQLRGIPVVYDFLANSAGVTASCFEWLRNLADRFRYESEVIREEPFDSAVLNGYIMPEFRLRIKSILKHKESELTTRRWNDLLRDIMFVAVNDDYHYAGQHNISMKTAGFVNSICRVLTAEILKSSPEKRRELWRLLPQQTRSIVQEYFSHPEAEFHNKNARQIIASLCGS